MHRENLFACGCHIRPLFWPHARATAQSDARDTWSRNMTSHCNKHRVAPLSAYAALDDAQQSRFVMSAPGAASGGRDLLSGPHPCAPRQSRTQRVSRLDLRSLADNSCVTLAMTPRWRAAQSACDAAARIASIASWSDSISINAQRAETAAHTNRPVLHWLRADARAARADLGKARALAPQAGFVITHFAALRSHRTDTRAGGS